MVVRKKFRKSFCVVLSLVSLMLPFLSLSLQQANADTVADSIPSEYVQIEDTNLFQNAFAPGSNEIETFSINNSPTEAVALGGITIFFAGMAIGWVVDGVITYSTGKAPSEWVAWGLSSMEAKVRSASQNRILVIVSADGSVSGCVSYPCPIMSSVPI